MKTVNRPPGRPRLADGEASINFGLRLPATVVGRLKKQAKSQKLSTSIFVRQILIAKAEEVLTNK